MTPSAPDLLLTQRAFFTSGATRPEAYRREQLKKLLAALDSFEEPLLRALYVDLGKSDLEGYETELAVLKLQLRHTLKHLHRWMRPKRYSTPIAAFPGKSRVVREPLGVVLILAPFNYPVQLALSPLISAIAAGNCAVVKPSPRAPASCEVLCRLLNETFPPDYIQAVNPPHAEALTLPSLPFDHIFFTGSPETGRKIMAAAAQNLTPVTLELGGKSPCIVDQSADLPLAARRILWGKALNAGQTCVAPDYLFLHSAVRESFLAQMRAASLAFFGPEPLSSPDLPSLVDESAFNRACALLETGKVLLGGKTDPTTRKIEPTLLVPAPGSPLLYDEIFAPLLPILPFETYADLEREILSRPRPLALYVFSKDKSLARRLFSEFPFGGGCYNDTVLHLTNPALPFGGVGNSGMGSSHGERGFLAFTHEKSLLLRESSFDPSLRYPPYQGKLSLLKKLMK